MRVHWTKTAKGHILEIKRYIAQNSPTYAEQVVDRLTRRSQQLSEFPFSGRMVDAIGMEQIREVIEGPYRIIYYIRPDQIDVLGVIHGARDLLR